MTKKKAAFTTGMLITLIGAYVGWSIKSPDAKLRLESELDQASRAVVFDYIDENPPRSRSLSSREIWWRLCNPYARKTELFSASKVDFFDGSEAVSIAYPDDAQSVFLKVSVDGSWELFDPPIAQLKIGSLFGKYEEADKPRHIAPH